MTAVEWWYGTWKSSNIVASYLSWIEGARVRGLEGRWNVSSRGSTGTTQSLGVGTSTTRFLSAVLTCFIYSRRFSYYNVCVSV
jgi:hypothetical protein